MKLKLIFLLRAVNSLQIRTMPSSSSRMYRVDITTKELFGYEKINEKYNISATDETPFKIYITQGDRIISYTETVKRDDDNFVIHKFYYNKDYFENFSQILPKFLIRRQLGENNNFLYFPPDIKVLENEDNGKILKSK